MHGTRLVASDFGTQRYREAIPAIDRDDRDGQVDQRLFIEMTANCGVQVIRHVIAGELRDGFGNLDGRVFCDTVRSKESANVQLAASFVAQD